MEPMLNLYARYSIMNYDCGMLPPETSGWFRTETRSVGDLMPVASDVTAHVHAQEESYLIYRPGVWVRPAAFGS